MKQDTQEKQGQIIEAAIRRFSHFGFLKTTLSEIAEDVSISKQALSYYYPDKQSIVAAVEDKILFDYKAELKKVLAEASSVKSALLGLLKLKKSFFEKYYMLVSEAEGSELLNSKGMVGWRGSLKEAEIKLLSPVLEKGVQSGELRPLDSVYTSQLLLDTLYAFRKCMEDKPIPTASSFHKVFGRQLEVTELFYNGLKTPTWKS